MEQPISIELMPSADRASVIVLFRSNEPIRMRMLVDSLEKYVEALKEKFPMSPIERLNPPSIIIP